MAHVGYLFDLVLSQNPAVAQDTWQQSRRKCAPRGFVLQAASEGLQ